MSALWPKIPWLGFGGLWRCANNAPDGLDYEPVIRSGLYLVGREGFEPVYPSLMRGALIPNELPALIWSIWRGSNPHLLVGSQT